MPLRDAAPSRAAVPARSAAAPPPRREEAGGGQQRRRDQRDEEDDDAELSAVESGRSFNGQACSTFRERAEDDEHRTSATCALRSRAGSTCAALEALDDTGDGLAEADAHCADAVAGVRRSKLRHERRRDPCARRAERMAERDAPPFGSRPCS